MFCLHSSLSEVGVIKTIRSFPKKTPHPCCTYQPFSRLITQHMSGGVLVFAAEAAAAAAAAPALVPQRYTACYRGRQQLCRRRGERLGLLRITTLPRLCAGLHFQKCFLCAKPPSSFCRCVPRRCRHINDGISQN